jgi:hypothetical protein
MQRGPVRRGAGDERATAVVDALVDGGFMDETRRGDAVALVTSTMAAQGSGAVPVRRRFAELAGYLGAALVVSAAGIFFAAQWPDLTGGQQVALLAGSAVLLGAAGLAVGGLGSSFSRMRAGADSVLRRLTGVLLAGAAASAGAAVGLQVERSAGTGESLALMLGFGTVTLLALVGYLVVPTVLGQVVTAAGAFLTVPSTLDRVGDVEPVAFGLVVLAIGVAWLLLAEAGWWREVAAGRVIGCVLAVAGAQIPVVDYDNRWVGYVALAVVAAAAFGGYVLRPSWPYLATGVVAVTLAVPQALLDWTDDGLGPAGVLLATGVTLIGASLLGLRLRQEVTPDGGS